MTRGYIYVCVYIYILYISSHIIPSCLVKSPGDFSHPKFFQPFFDGQGATSGSMFMDSKRAWRRKWAVLLWKWLATSPLNHAAVFLTQTMRHGYFRNICDWRFHHWTMLKYPCDPLKHGYFSLILSRKHGHFPSLPKIWHGPPFIHFLAAYMVKTKINNEMEWCTLGTLAGRIHGFGYCTKTGRPPEEETAWQFVHLALLIPPVNWGRKLGILKNTAMTNPCNYSWILSIWQWILSCIQLV